MSERYITDRYLPDKAIDLIDEACSNVNLENRTLARRAEVDKELADLDKEKEVMMAAATEESYARLAAIRSQELAGAGEGTAGAAPRGPPGWSIWPTSSSCGPRSPPARSRNVSTSAWPGWRSG